MNDQDIEYIIELARLEKPEKRIREYINSHGTNTKRIEFYNRTYRTFFGRYFSTFAGPLRGECIMEAYTTGLSRLNNGASLEDALQDGMAAGHRYFKRERIA